ncbi:HlyD family efflux transporter periplasmic adaptor subunit [Clostridium aminobutyricum]|uniref:HlyD family secretion protein n=1 Tax=Clostridium aminobutyricum TaxID=33953 RepID=A0A939IJV2_CLOAM|nr:HlyD family efflux transporter periplasmic adaptor subunit [Clostridium aminobutyricum]MBN7773983.1 HlyD family secretion protein [Clostridium aminobutyricum]
MESKRKVLMLSVVAVMLIVLGSIGIYYWYENNYYVATEDAKVAGDIVKVSPQMTGKLLELEVEEGQSLEKDQIIGHQEMGSLSDLNLEQSVIRSPISGFVLKKQATQGELVATGQTLIMMVDPTKLYINANIEETDIAKLKIGQKVEITVDEFSGEKMYGKVQSIGKAANSAFSLLSGSSSGTFTKVVQRVPVKIVFDENQNHSGILLGTNAVIKIHIR